MDSINYNYNNYEYDYGIFLDCKNGRTYDEQTRSPNMNRCGKCCNMDYYTRCYATPQRACETYDVQRCPRGSGNPGSLAAQYPYNYGQDIRPTQRVPYYFPHSIEANRGSDDKPSKEKFSGSTYKDDGDDVVKIDRQTLILLMVICVLYLVITSAGAGNSNGNLSTLIDDRIKIVMRDR